jgi:hypothetical protein
MSGNDSNKKSHAKSTMPRAAGKRKHPEHEEEPVSDLSMCHACELVDITAPQPHFSLLCVDECQICAACFSRCSSDRQCRPFLLSAHAANRTVRNGRCNTLKP